MFSNTIKKYYHYHFVKYSIFHHYILQFYFVHKSAKLHISIANIIFREIAFRINHDAILYFVFLYSPVSTKGRLKIRKYLEVISNKSSKGKLHIYQHINTYLESFGKIIRQNAKLKIN